MLRAGDHIVSSRSIFGTTTTLFDKYLPRFGIETSFVDLTDLEDWKQSIRQRIPACCSWRHHRIHFPKLPISGKLADLAHENNCMLVVDNCFCTPALQRPLELGADIIVHSATKYLDGQGRIVGGAIVGPNPLVNEDIFGVIRSTGPQYEPVQRLGCFEGT